VGRKNIRADTRKGKNLTEGGTKRGPQGKKSTPGGRSRL